MKPGRISTTLSLVLKLTVIACAALGICISGSNGRTVFMGGSTAFMFFTVQSNIGVALIAFVGYLLMAFNRKAGRAGQLIRLMGAVSITLTGVVYCFVLAPTLKAGAWDTQNVLLHVVVPIVAVLDFFVIGWADTYRKSDAAWVVVPPLLYAIYAGIGYAAGWEFLPGVNYPYFFLNWGSPAGALGFCEGLPFMGCVWWILVLLVFLIAVASLYLFILKRIKKRLSNPNA